MCANHFQHLLLPTVCHLCPELKCSVSHKNFQYLNKCYILYTFTICLKFEVGIQTHITNTLLTIPTL